MRPATTKPTRATIPAEAPFAMAPPAVGLGDGEPEPDGEVEEEEEWELTKTLVSIDRLDQLVVLT